MIDWKEIVANPKAPSMCEAFGLDRQTEKALISILADQVGKVETVADLVKAVCEMPLSDREHAYAIYMIAAATVRAFELDELLRNGGSN